MRRPAFAWAGALTLGGAALALYALPLRSRVTCGAGFTPSGARCLAQDKCPPPLRKTDSSCDADGRIAVPKTKLSIGPSDWEAEGRVVPRIIEAGPFWIDAFEATAQAFAGHVVDDPMRAASGITRHEAELFCAKRDGRLPTEDEWMIAAAGLGGHRYPWGETGAVCRRAAFGLARGPCAFDGNGPDTVGAHSDGDGARGVHDLAGNVAEWVAPRADGKGGGVAKGGSWRTEVASDLRVWARLEVDPDARDDRVGVRCAYDAP